MHSRRTGGIALAFYGVVTFVAFIDNAPGGDYRESMIRRFMSPGHMWPAFGLAYLGALGALALLVFGTAIRRDAGPVRDLVWGLTVVGTAGSLVGWFVVGGLAAAMAEGSDPVRGAIAHPVVYTVAEIGNLLAVCSPALCVGVAGILLATRGDLPKGFRTFTVVAGVCGILAPAFFPYFVYLLWTVVAGVRIATWRRVESPTAQPEVSFA